ncbi:MAG: aldose epimerase family protein [Verrucomicrobiota bacterium]
MKWRRFEFGELPGGTKARLFELEGEGGLRVSLSDFGGHVTRIQVPTHEGLRDVALGHDRLEPYRITEGNPYLGSLIGRFANRIREGRFVLDGEEHQVAVNESPHTLHGGDGGFHSRLWRATPLTDGDRVGLRLERESPHGEEGFPGRLLVTVFYWVRADNALEIRYQARTDRPTILNLTNHTYFNLGGRGEEIGEHQAVIHGSRFLPIDPEFIPTGDWLPVAGTPFDLRSPRPIGQGLRSGHPQIRRAKGYDHTWVLDGPDKKGQELRPAAKVEAEGVALEVWTDQPGLQFYTGNSLDGKARGRHGQRLARQTGFCLEAQNFPNAPNHAHFPSSVLRPGETYRQRTEYRFR